MNWENARLMLIPGTAGGTRRYNMGQFQLAVESLPPLNIRRNFDFEIYSVIGRRGDICEVPVVLDVYTDEGAGSGYMEAVGKDSVLVIFNAKKVQESTHQ